MQRVMDALAPAGAAPATGPQLDNRRVAAALIDLALLVPVALLMSLLFDGFTPAAAALTWGWALYYYFALESGGGQTLGKRVMKLRVARADGAPLDMGRVAVRTLLRPIDAIGAYLLGLVVMLATGQRRQRLGDLAAGTVVTEAAAPGAEPVAAAVAAPEAPVIEAPPVEDHPPADEHGDPALEEAEPPAVEIQPDVAEADSPVADTGLPAPPPFEPPGYEPAPHEFAPLEATEAPEAEPGVPEVRPFEPFGEEEPAAEEPSVEEEPADAEDETLEVTGPKLEIVSSPIDLVMDEQQDEPEAEHGEDEPDPDPGPASA
jgi:uncharacterized RDD family membrane protein YckC